MHLAYQQGTPNWARAFTIDWFLHVAGRATGEQRSDATSLETSKHSSGFRAWPSQARRRWQIYIPIHLFNLNKLYIFPILNSLLLL